MCRKVDLILFSVRMCVIFLELAAFFLPNEPRRCAVRLRQCCWASAGSLVPASPGSLAPAGGVGVTWYLNSLVTSCLPRGRAVSWASPGECKVP